MLAERENGTTMIVCAEQLNAIALCLKEEDWKKIVIAYGESTSRPKYLEDEHDRHYRTVA